jgi:hypothetical protein
MAQAGAAMLPFVSASTAGIKSGQLNPCLPRIKS